VKCFFCDIDTDINRFRHGFLPYLQMRTRRAYGSSAVQTAVRVSPTVAARFPLCDGLEDPDTIELSSPAGVGSARYARLANTRFTYETIINHDRCQHTRAQRTQRTIFLFSHKGHREYRELIFILATEDTEHTEK
jgi:hypothetical protein